MNATSKGVELNWAGGVIRPGEGYGGRPEQIPEGCPPVLGAPGDAPKRDRREVICEDDVAAVFDKGALTKAEAARKLGASTGASQATCYRALDEGGRFARYLRFNNGKVRWR
jgi:hypothetical protein